MVGLGSGNAVRPNSELSLLTLKVFKKGSNPPPSWHCYTHWTTSIRDQPPLIKFKLLHSLRIFRRNQPNHYTHWRSSIKDQIHHPQGTIRFIEKGEEGILQNKFSMTLTKPQTIPYQSYMFMQSFCTEITTDFALRQDVMNCIPGKRRLQASVHIYPEIIMIFFFKNR